MRTLPAFTLMLVLAAAAAAAPWRAHERNSPGWRWLTPPERVEHQRRLRAMRAYGECRAYLDAHHAMLAERARRAGQTFEPRSPDACEELRARGDIR